MLRLIGWAIKLGLFAAIVLVLGHVVTWKGQTISDQVKTQISHAERMDLVGQVKHWTNKTLGEERGAHGAPSNGKQKDEQILSSERQKLKALIQELNGKR